MTCRVLILDSDPLDAIAVRTALEQDERISAILVTTPAEMQEVMDADPVDVVLADLEAPGFDGVKLLEDLREEHAECLVIVRTPYGSLRSAVDALRAGAFDYIVKPCLPERVREHVERAILRSETLRAKNEAARKNLVRQLAASINHEINNPLTTIMGTAELILAEKEKLTAKIRRDLQTIVEQCLRIREVTSRLRDLPEIHTTKYGMWETMIDLRPFDGKDEEPLAHGRQPRRRIFVVDDNEMMVSMMKRMFDAEFEISGYPTGADALRALKGDKTPDVLMIEMILPDVAGAELVRRVRELHPSLPIVLLAGYHDEECIAEARENGAQALLYKPIHSEEFRRKVLEMTTHSLSPTGSGLGAETTAASSSKKKRGGHA